MEQILKKLGYKEQERILLIHAPEDLKEDLVAAFHTQPAEEILEDQEFVLFFARELKEVRTAAERLAASIAPQGRLWIAYPKKSGKKYESDLSRDILWDAFKDYSFEPVSNFAIDADWSAIRFRPVSEIPSMKRKKAATEEGKSRVRDERKD